MRMNFGNCVLTRYCAFVGNANGAFAHKRGGDMLGPRLNGKLCDLQMDGY